jgi:protein-tyrosine phosphatase
MTFVKLDGAFNVRDIGGLAAVNSGRTRSGLLYRGDSLDAISKRDAHRLFGELRIGVVIDVRSPQEIAPALWKESAVSTYEFPMIGNGGIGTQPMFGPAAPSLADSYLGDLNSGASAVLATLEVLANQLSNQIPCLVHCAAGRDRTGVIFATLLAAIGVTDADVAFDYVAGNHQARQMTKRLAGNPLYANGLSPSGEPVLASADTIMEFLALLRAAYGGPTQFLDRCGLAETTLARLTAALIENPGSGETSRRPGA